MSELPHAEELLAFRGLVECRRGFGAIALQLRGVQREADGVTDVLFAGATAALPALPAQLHDARVLQLPASFRIESLEGVFTLQARSIQLHRAVAARFFQAVPPASVALRVRLGWTLLLSMLRVPGMSRLLERG